MNDKERIEALIKYSGKRINAFAIEIGLPNGNIFYNIKNGRNGISASLALKISKTYPEINQNWLVAGKGEMLLKKEEPKDELVKKIETLEEIIKGHSARLAVVESRLSKRV